MIDTAQLFAGGDGLGLGLNLAGGFRTVWFSEYDEAPSRVLAHHYPGIPNYGDITAIDFSTVEPVMCLTGGFPCQDVSKAGRGAGIKEGTRSGLWFEMRRAIRDLRPGLVIVENVSALLGRGMDIVLGDLAALGFDAWWTCLRASDVGAAHRRERVFIVAVTTDSDLLGRLHRQARVQPAEARIDAFGDAPAGGHEDVAWGEFEPAIRRWERVLGRPAPVPARDGQLTPEFVEWHMGFPAGWTAMLSREERLRLLGNAIVPQVGEVVGRWALDLVDAALVRREVA